MSIFSPSSTLYSSTVNPRVSLPPSTSTSQSSYRLRSVFRRFPCLALCSSGNATGGMTEMVQDMKFSSSSALLPDVASELGQYRPFLEARSEQDLLYGIQREMEAGTLPKSVAGLMEELYLNYRNAVFQSGHPHAEHIVLSNMSLAFNRILLDVKDPFEFSPYHEAIREPFNYYMFVQNYIRPLINFRESYVGNISLFYEIEEQLMQGKRSHF